jgi:hypothetical protein
VADINKKRYSQAEPSIVDKIYPYLEGWASEIDNADYADLKNIEKRVIAILKSNGAGDFNGLSGRKDYLKLSRMFHPDKNDGSLKSTKLFQFFGQIKSKLEDEKSSYSKSSNYSHKSDGKPEEKKENDFRDFIRNHGTEFYGLWDKDNVAKKAKVYLNTLGCEDLAKIRDDGTHAAWYRNMTNGVLNSKKPQHLDDLRTKARGMSREEIEQGLAEIETKKYSAGLLLRGLLSDEQDIFTVALRGKPAEKKENDFRDFIRNHGTKFYGLWDKDNVTKKAKVYLNTLGCEDLAKIKDDRTHADWYSDMANDVLNSKKPQHLDDLRAKARGMSREEIEQGLAEIKIKQSSAGLILWSLLSEEQDIFTVALRKNPAEKAAPSPKAETEWPAWKAQEPKKSKSKTQKDGGDSDRQDKDPLISEDLLKIMTGKMKSNANKKVLAALDTMNRGSLDEDSAKLLVKFFEKKNLKNFFGTKKGLMGKYKFLKGLMDVGSDNDIDVKKLSERILDLLAFDGNHRELRSISRAIGKKSNDLSYHMITELEDINLDDFTKANNEIIVTYISYINTIIEESDDKQTKKLISQSIPKIIRIIEKLIINKDANKSPHIQEMIYNLNRIIERKESAQNKMMG